MLTKALDIINCTNIDTTVAEETMFYLFHDKIMQVWWVWFGPQQSYDMSATGFPTLSGLSLFSRCTMMHSTCSCEFFRASKIPKCWTYWKCTLAWIFPFQLLCDERKVITHKNLIKIAENNLLVANLHWTEIKQCRGKPIWEANYYCHFSVTSPSSNTPRSSKIKERIHIRIVFGLMWS